MRHFPNIIKEKTKVTAASVKDQEQIITDTIKRVTDFVKTESEKQIEEINKRYQSEMDIAQTTIDKILEKTGDGDDQRVKELHELIQKLIQARDEELAKANKGSGGKGDYNGIGKLFGLDKGIKDSWLED